MENTKEIPTEKYEIMCKIVEASRKYMSQCFSEQYLPDGAEDLWFAVEAFNEYQEED